MTLFAYVGCYTTPERNGQGKGINVYRVDPRTGAFKHVQLLDGLENPSFLAVDAAGRFLYSVHGDRSEVTAYSIDRHSGRLGVMLAIAEYGPGQVVCVLALDELRPVLLERSANGAVAEQQPVLGAGRHRRRGDGDRDRPPVLDDRILRARHDQQMAMRRVSQDVLALPAQIGAHSPANVGPALRDVAK